MQRNSPRRGRQSVDRATARKIPTSNKKSPQTCAVAVWGLCVVYEWLTILPMMARWYVSVVSRRCTRVNNMPVTPPGWCGSWSAAPGGCCTVKGFGMLPNKSLQGKGLCTYKDTACSAYGGTTAHCLQVQGPLQEHTTFRESLVCYTSPPGGVDSLGFVRGSRLVRHSGWRSK